MNLIKKYSFLLLLIIVFTVASKTQAMYKGFSTYAIPLTLEQYYKEKKKEITISLENASCNHYYIKKIINRPEWGTIGYTPLCIAIEMNDLSFAQFLLDRGAEVNARIGEIFFSRPILFAHTIEMVKLLHHYNVNLFVLNEGKGEANGLNLLHIIKRYYPNNTSLINYLTAIGMK